MTAHPGVSVFIDLGPASPSETWCPSCHVHAEDFPVNTITEAGADRSGSVTFCPRCRKQVIR